MLVKENFNLYIKSKIISMKTNNVENYRKLARDFKGRIKLMKETPLDNIESLFLEVYELGLQDYIRNEKKRFPNKTRKEIILDMYKLHDKLRKRRF